jgi:hypothetical protein
MTGSELNALIVSETWQVEASEVFTSGGSWRQGPFRALCAVCHTPVKDEHDPVEVAYDDGGPGLIHGSFDCQDESRCGETIHGEAYGLEYGAQCVLPASHVATGSECIWGEPF